MRLTLNDAELRIRDELRAFLAEHLPAPDEIPIEFDARVAFLREWQRKLHEARLVNLTWPEEYGGRSATLMEQIVANQELARAGAPPLIGEVGLEVVGPTIVARGTPEQKALPEANHERRGHLVPGLLSLMPARPRVAPHTRR